MTADDERRVRAALERVLPALVAQLGGGAVEATTPRALHGGVATRSFVFAVHGRRFVLRLPAPRAIGAHDVATEARVMRAAAAAGLAPEVRVVAADAGLLVTDYRAARAWSAADARRAANVKRIAQLLAVLHPLAADAPRFSAAGVARRYVAELEAAAPRAGLEHFGPRVRAYADEWLERAHVHDAAAADDALCHNDLVAANVLDDGALALVDFEYAVRGPRVLDLAGLAGLNDYGRDARRALLAAYAQANAVAIGERELDAAIRLVRLQAYFWARLAAHSEPDSVAHAGLVATLAAALEA